jgi:UDP-N-acetylmuramate dehydrogenase
MMQKEELAAKLNTLIQGDVQVDAPMSLHTSFKIGGPADVLVIPKEETDIAAVLAFARETGTPLTVLGNGSNVLVRDKGIRGIVLVLGNTMKYARREGNRMVFSAGLSLAAASRAAGEAVLTGMEFAVGIPGSIGGALYMNAGAYDGEMKNVVVSARLLSYEGTEFTLTREALHLGYRHSVLQERPAIVLDITTEMQPGDKDAIQQKMEDFSSRRASRQPLEMPSAGSTFRRPEGHFVGPMIEKAGLKGYRIGGAEVSRKHAGFVVNAGGATAADVLALIRHIQETIRRTDGVELVPEVLILGEE